MLIIFGGLPGAGKSTIARKLAQQLKAVYLRIDSIEQAIKNASELYNQNTKIEIIAEGYMTACALAQDNLEIGLTVITDSVNPIEITRNAYRKIAQETNHPFLEIEIFCSDKARHQERIETRKTTVPNLKLPTWQEVIDRDYEFWETKHLGIDTASCTVDEAAERIIALIKGGIYGRIKM